MTSELDERPELGSGYYTYQFGGNLGKNSYICTFSYRNNEEQKTNGKSRIRKITNNNLPL